VGGPWKKDSKKTTESSLWLDIRWLKKQGRLRLGTTGTLSWSRRDREIGSIRYSMEGSHMTLNFRSRPHGGEWEEVGQVIHFDFTPCNYGGYRTWFLCPCGKRVAVLYGTGKYFLCRHCCDLVYASQQESQPDRLMRKARKIRAQLGASGDLTKPIWQKPKNMHWKTFDRLRREADLLNLLSWGNIAQRLGIK
jgi:hypothetical protein